MFTWPEALAWLTKQRRRACAACGAMRGGKAARTDSGTAHVQDNALAQIEVQLVPSTTQLPRAQDGAADISWLVDSFAIGTFPFTSRHVHGGDDIKWNKNHIIVI